MIALALDPGVTTGYAMGDVYLGRMSVLTGEERFNHLEFYKFLCESKPRFIIYERFDARHSRFSQGVELFSREIIGVAELYAQQKKIKVYKQMPSQAKTSFSDEKLKKSVIFKPAKEHANDAVRHLLYWFTFGSGYQYNKHGFKSGT